VCFPLFKSFFHAPFGDVKQLQKFSFVKSCRHSRSPFPPFLICVSKQKAIAKHSHSEVSNHGVLVKILVVRRVKLLHDLHIADAESRFDASKTHDILGAILGVFFIVQLGQGRHIVVGIFLAIVLLFDLADERAGQRIGFVDNFNRWLALVVSSEHPVLEYSVIEDV
jgi:hypothetical protein